MTIGEKIKQARKNRGMTQEQLAEKMIVSRAAVAKWENGNGVPDIENLKKLSQVFGMSIDELMDHSVRTNTKENDTKQEYYKTYIGKKCNIEMIDWNDGIVDSYLVNQDERFVYYATVGKKNTKVGALAKRYIKKIEVSAKKEKVAVDISDFAEIKREYFCNKSADVYLEDKHFLSGILGKATELLNVDIQDVTEEWLILVTDMEIEINKITKMETKMMY